MSQADSAPSTNAVRVDYEDLVAFVAAILNQRGLDSHRARTAATALCYGDLVGQHTHGVDNLTRLYLPLIDEGRVDVGADLHIVADSGAAVLLDAQQALGLWAASEAMDVAVARADSYGIGMVSVRAATHFGCAGHHAVRAVRSDMIGLVASNCGTQRIVRPPQGQLAMLGTNPLSVAAPAGDHPPFVLDMSTTAAPAGRIREAARTDRSVPPGWLADDQGQPVTDPATFDRGDAHLLWLGGDSGSGAHKGFGLGLMVEVLAALLPGAGLGPGQAALDGDGTPCGRDDDVGFLVAAINPGALRPRQDVTRDAHTMFDTLLACPPSQANVPVRYPGWLEAERARHHRRDGVPLTQARYDELCDLGRRSGMPPPEPIGAS